MGKKSRKKNLKKNLKKDKKQAQVAKGLLKSRRSECITPECCCVAVQMGLCKTCFSAAKLAIALNYTSWDKLVGCGLAYNANRPADERSGVSWISLWRAAKKEEKERNERFQAEVDAKDKHHSDTEFDEFGFSIAKPNPHAGKTKEQINQEICDAVDRLSE